MSQQQPNVKELLTNAEKHLHRMFLAGAILGALACFARADYNLPLYAFLYIMWDQDDVSTTFEGSSLESIMRHKLSPNMIKYSACLIKKNFALWSIVTLKATTNLVRGA